LRSAGAGCSNANEATEYNQLTGTGLIPNGMGGGGAVHMLFENRYSGIDVPSHLAQNACNARISRGVGKPPAPFGAIAQFVNTRSVHEAPTSRASLPEAA